jgi:hypothetical protein
MIRGYWEPSRPPGDKGRLTVTHSSDSQFVVKELAATMHFSGRI